MEYTAEEIISELGIKENVVNIYPYGSRVYGNHSEESDYDFVIVCKSSMLLSGAFKDNPISNKDFTIQGILYSRGGFTDALNNYDITALECIFLEREKIIMNDWKAFRLNNLDIKKLAKALISKASMSLHSAKNFKKRDNIKKARLGVFHAIRILTFGNQIKEFGKITDYSACNKLKSEIMKVDDFHIRDYNTTINELTEKLKSDYIETV